jgi:hypothetical protein
MHLVNVLRDKPLIRYGFPLIFLFCSRRLGANGLAAHPLVNVLAPNRLCIVGYL